MGEEERIWKSREDKKKDDIKSIKRLVADSKGTK